MSKVHNVNTSPEIRVRKLLHSMGYHFRFYRSDLPGNSDIVLPKYKTVIFVHVCFWHGCPKCKHTQVRTKSNAEYWSNKLDRNIQRDKDNFEALENMGWCVIIVWECETKKKNLETLGERSKSILSST